MCKTNAERGTAKYFTNKFGENEILPDNATNCPPGQSRSPVSIQNATTSSNTDFLNKDVNGSNNTDLKYFRNNQCLYVCPGTTVYRDIAGDTSCECFDTCDNTNTYRFRLE
jgi:hypothetical protein